MALERFILLFADWLTLTGWRRNIFSFFVGAVSTLALAPFHIMPVLFLTLPILVFWANPDSGKGPYAINKGETDLNFFIKPTFSWKQASCGFSIGWWFGFGFHLAGLYWIGNAFMVQKELFAWLIPIAITLMPASLAIFYGLAIALLACISGSAVARVLVLVLTFSATEWFRGNVLTGFPWNTLGYALAHPLIFLQTASVLGIYGMTAITVCVCSAPLPVFLEAIQRKQKAKSIRPILVLTIIPLIIMAVYGVYSLTQTPVNVANDVRLRIVQPSIKQRDKFDPSKRAEILTRHLELSSFGLEQASQEGKGITHIIWPEAALAFLALRSNEVLMSIATTLPDEITLIAGTIRVIYENTVKRNHDKVFNSAMIVDGGGNFIATYDKVHLVPFGEYLPLQNLLEAIGLEQLTRLKGGFTSGSRHQPPPRIPGIPDARILICYEIIFPDYTNFGSKRPSVLINLTNDSWYGLSTGPFQHFHQSIVRAVEQGVPLIRAGNNGISAVVDGHGRIISRLNLNDVGVVDASLPKPIKPTIYSYFGDITFAVFWFSLLFLLYACLRLSDARKQRKTNL